MRRLFKILIGVAIFLLILIIILLAVLIPRPVPCNKKPIVVEDASHSVRLSVNDTLLSQVVCQNGESLLPLLMTGSFFDLRKSLKDFNGVVSFSFGGLEPESFQMDKCTDQKVWMRPSVLLCEEALADFPPVEANDLAQAVDLVAVNPKPCSDSATVPVTVINETLLDFQVTSIIPSLVCLDKGPYDLDVVGTGFLWIQDIWSERKPLVYWMNEEEPYEVFFHNDTCTNITQVEGVYVRVCTRFTVTVPNIADATVKGANITIANAAPCSAVHTQTLSVISGGTVLVVAVTPGVIYNDVTIQISILIAGLGNQTIPEVIFEKGSESISVTPDAMTRSSRVPVTIPRLLLEPGVWDIVVAASGDPSGCHARLAAALTVVDQATDLDSVDPKFAYVGADTTGIVITGSGFQDVPQAYLSLSDGTQSALLVNGLTFVSPNEITGVVRQSDLNLPAGSYDVIVINPDGTVGVIRDGFVIVTSPPPVLTAFDPTALAENVDTIDLLGSNLENITSVEITCRSLSTGTITNPAATVSNVSDTRITISFNTIVDNYCSAKVITDTGIFASFSGVPIKQLNLNPSTVQVIPTTLTVARRAHAMAVTTPTSTSRFIYAIGGDNSADGAYTTSITTVYSSVEVAVLGSLGEVGAFSILPYSLPSACTYSEAVTLSNFVYLLCGYTNNSESNIIYRAAVLNPLATPTPDVDVIFKEGEAYDQFNISRTYQYKISAYFDESDPTNPDGESLPGEALTLTLPALNGLGNFDVVLSWDPIPGASYYRIYRTLTDSTSVSQLGLLAEINETTYTDTGFIDPDESRPPLPPGSVGKWHAVASLNTPRSWGSIAYTEDPTTAGSYLLFAFGGVDDGTILDSYEYATITVTAPGSATDRESQTLSAWTVATSVLPAAVFGHRSAVIRSPHPSLASGTSRIYTGFGRLAFGTTGVGFNTKMFSAVVSANPPELTWTSIELSDSRVGFCALTYKIDQPAKTVLVWYGSKNVGGQAEFLDTDLTVVDANNAGLSGSPTRNGVSCIQAGIAVMTGGHGPSNEVRINYL